MTPRTTVPAVIVLSLGLLSCGGGSDSGSAASPAPTQGISGTGAGSACTHDATNKGIEGTGLRQKLTGRITGITSDNSTMTLSSASVATTGAAVFNGDVAGNLSDLQVDQVITALGTFDPTGSGQACSIYILSTAGTPVTTQEVEVFAPTVRGTWYTFDGPEVAVSPTATVLIDGVSVPVAGLSILAGEVALVSGNVVFDADHNPGGLMTADRVELSHVVDGPIDSVDLVHSRLIVLGLTILVDGGTAINDAGSDLRSVQVGERVTVAGHATASDQVLATSINPSALTGDFVVTAFVTSVDPTQKQMVAGNLTIDYSTASLQGFPASGPNVGDRIRLRGRRSAGATNLTASSLSYLSPRLAGSPGSIAALHGLVTSMSSVSTVTVDGYAVVLSGAAVQSCGSPPALNALVTLDGMLQASGEVIADVFCFDQPQGTGINVTGRVDAIDPVFGTLSILGFQVQPSITTRVTFGGKTASLSDIRVGDYALSQGGGGLVDADVLVSQLVRYTWPAPTVIEAAYGYIRFADPLVSVEGRLISTDANTQFSFVGPDGNHTVGSMTRELFFSNPHYFPYWDRICRPTLRFSVNQNADGSLTATSVLWEPDYC